ncbi:unnamed protein product [Schistosoma margrebowiei]|uniref:Uncharacterized protein n=1 Tax=Schistosoma margrebowiei TaxID=48269 RepID=A0A183LWU0_9TREM|nr:unnamed protein product [Schistosoma margrebowiei]
MTTTVEETSAVVGIDMHKGKSKIFEYNTQNTNSITLDGGTLEDVETFTYLGSNVIDERGGSDALVRSRIDKLRTVFLKSNNTWNSKQLSTNPPTH